MGRCYREGSLTKIPLFIVATILLLPILNVSGTNSDFDNATLLQSGVTHDGLIEGDNEKFFKLGVPIADVIEFQFNDLDGQYIEFCVYDGNRSSDRVECVGEHTSPGSTTYFQKATKSVYFVKIYCGECAGGQNGGDARYSLSATVHEDEAGDTLEDAKELFPEVRIYGWAALDDSAEPIDFDYYRTPVIEGDTVRIVITSSDMTSYRIYDQYGIKIGDGYEEGNYDFSINFDYSGDLFIELFCTQNGGEPCDYSLIAIGSTYVDSPAQDSEVTEEQSSAGSLTNSLSTTIAVVVGLLVIVGLILRTRSESSASVQPSIQNESVNDEIQRLQQTVTRAELEKTHMQDELEKAKSTTVVQNITYNIQDSAIAGDINATGLKEKDD